jgi:hypothetical protein
MGQDKCRLPSQLVGFRGVIRGSGQGGRAGLRQRQAWFDSDSCLPHIRRSTGSIRSVDAAAEDVKHRPVPTLVINWNGNTADLGVLLETRSIARNAHAANQTRAAQSDPMEVPATIVIAMRTHHAVDRAVELLDGGGVPRSAITGATTNAGNSDLSANGESV